MSVSLDKQIACVRRELAVRRKCYASLVAAKRMLQATATRELEELRAVLTTLITLKESR